MNTADPAASAEPTLSCSSALSLWSANLPTTAPEAPPTTTEASIAGANSPTRTRTPAPQLIPLRPR